jgi:hypothetical protein
VILMKYVLALLTIGILLTSGCTPAAVKYAQGRNPTCKVTALQRTGGATTVLIQCPGEDPRTETFTER